MMASSLSLLGRIFQVFERENTRGVCPLLSKFRRVVSLDYREKRA